MDEPLGIINQKNYNSNWKNYWDSETFRKSQESTRPKPIIGKKWDIIHSNFEYGSW